MQMEETVSSSKGISFQASSSLSSRFEGLIDVSLASKVRSSLIGIFNYFDNFAPKMPLVYGLCTLLRCLQLIGAATMVANSKVWDLTTLSGQVMSIFSVFFHFIPAAFRKGMEATYLFIFGGIIAVFLVYLLITGLMYKATTKVPNASCYILSFFIALFAFTLPTVVAQFAGQMMAGLIMGTIPANGINISALVFGIILATVQVVILVKIYSLTLTFRPCSFLTIEGSPQNRLLVSTFVVTFLLALTTDMHYIAQAVLIAISVFVYGYAAKTCFNCGSYIKEGHQAMVLGCCITSIVCALAGILSALINLVFNEVAIVILVVIWIISFLVSNAITKSRVRKQLAILDNFEEGRDITVFANFKSFKTVLSAGFTYAHPTCVDYTIFKAACEEWPSNIGVWANYAKFAAIYPENARTLIFISQNIVGLKMKGVIAETVLQNIANIVKTRETNLSPDLKNKISKIAKAVTKTKNKLRNIWDLVLQGNTADMEQAVHIAADSVYDSEIELNHLIMLYPNNRFVARQFARFQKDVKADQFMYKKWTENVHVLQRGGQINADTIQALTSVVFPNLPDKIENTTNAGYLTEMDTATDEFLSEEEATVDGTDLIANLIDSHTVKAVTFIRFTTTINFVVFILFPILFLLCYFNVYADTLKAPLDIMYGIASLRNLINMLTAFATKYCATFAMDPVNNSKNLMSLSIVGAGIEMNCFGQNKVIIDIINYLLKRVVSTSGLVSQLSNYQIGNENINNARSQVFDNILNYTFYRNRTDFDITASSSETIGSMVANQIAQLVSIERFNNITIKEATALTSINNNNQPTLALNIALESMISFIMELDEENQNTMMYAMIALICFIVIVDLCIVTAQFKLLINHRNEIYKLLTTLPKTVISSVSSSFYSIKHGNANSSATTTDDSNDINKQEENIIKVFSSISDGGLNSSNEVKAFIIFAFIIASAVLAFYLLFASYQDASTTLIESCPHINYLLGSNTLLYSMLASLIKISVEYIHPDYSGFVIDINSEIESVTSALPTIMTYFHQMRFGGVSDREFPFVGTEQALADADLVVVCENLTQTYTGLIDGTKCFNSETQFYLSLACIKRFISLAILGIYPEPDDLAGLWSIGPLYLYESFFYPCSFGMADTIAAEIESTFPKMLGIGLGLSLSALFFSCIILYSAYVENSYMKFTLRQLLFCPPKVILSSNRIMSLLAGNYSSAVDDTAERDADFFGLVVNKLNDFIIVSHVEDNLIISVNATFEKVFNVELKNLINTNIHDFFTKDRFEDENLDTICTKPGDVVYKNGDEKMYINFKMNIVNGNRILIGRNQTTRVMHRQLIAEERKKSDAMLSSILPASLVPRVQNGEKDISFSVQSVSVLFLDIVEFTPWCGSNTAQYVMKTLNAIFKELDALVSTHKTMTKIKCIGDCYMAAGGIFDEVNQPTVHSKEVVQFGCEAINKLLEIDDNLNEKLRIRVGINTGGPIVAGVLGTEKPTFEILGPTINIAQQMEHHGVPMMVHISRTVYELIYGGSFKIKERGEVELKNGKMFTYLVSPN